MKIYGAEVAEGSEITNLTVKTGTGDPSNPNAGELFFRTDTGKLRIYNGTSWLDINTGTAGGVSTFIDLTDTPSSFTGSGSYLLRVNSGATAVEFVDGTGLFASSSHNHDSTYVNVSGDTMTGVLQLPAGSSSAPSINFGDTSTGFYKYGTNEIGITLNGTRHTRFMANAIMPFSETNTTLVRPTVYNNSNLFGAFDAYSYGGSISTPAAVASGRGLARFGGVGYDGTIVHRAAEMIMVTSAAWSETSRPAHISFLTTPVDGTSSTERMRITSSGALLIATTTDNGTDKLQVNGTAVVTAPNSAADNTQVPTTSWVRTYASGAYQPVDADLTAIAGITREAGALIVGGASAWEKLAPDTPGPTYNLQLNGTTISWAPQSSPPAIPEYLNDLSDVQGTPSNGQVLTWNNTGSYWEPLAPTGGVTDHGALTGLGDDDHTQYILANGSRSITKLGVGATTPASDVTHVSLNGNVTGGTILFGLKAEGVIQPDVTGYFYGIRSLWSTAASSFTIGELWNFSVGQGTVGAGSTITNQYGYHVGNAFTYATNNYGFVGKIPSGANNWNLYMDGTAKNHIAGTLLLGTTTDNGTDKLQVSGTVVVTAPDSAANNSQVPTTAWVRTFAGGDTSPTPNTLARRDASGDLYAVNFVSSSDQTLKKDIRPIENALDIVNNLEGKRFKFIDNEREQVGFIAQEVEKVLPEVVETSGDGMKFVGYANITAVLAEAIKEQNKKIEELQQLVKSLMENTMGDK